jgi:hypothetical protein
MTFFDDLGKTIYSAANTALTLITHPISSITNFNEAYHQTANQGLLENEVRGITNTLIATAPASGAIRSTVASSIAKFAVENPVKTLVAIPVGVTSLSLLASSQKVKSVVSDPYSLVNFGQQLGTVIDNPSASNLKQVAVTHPILTTGSITLGTYLAGKGISSALNLLATKANTDAVIANTKATAGIGGPTGSNDSYSDYKGQADLIDANTKSQLQIIEAQTKAQKDLLKEQAKYSTVPKPSDSGVVASTSSTAPPDSKPKKKKKNTKKKKKTRRSKKKKNKKRKH